MSSLSVSTTSSASSKICVQSNHPAMENDVILRMIFQYSHIGFKSVKKRRLVCKAWKRASEPQWKSLTVSVIILQDESIQQQEISHEKTNPIIIPLSQFIRHQNDPNRTKYRNLELKNWEILSSHFTANENGDADMNQCFWKVHAKNAAVLTLNGCTFPRRGNPFKRDFSKLLPKMVKLSWVNCKVATDPQLQTSNQKVGSPNADHLHCRINAWRQQQIDRPPYIDPYVGMPQGLEKFLIILMLRYHSFVSLRIQNMEGMRESYQIVWSSPLLSEEFPKLKVFSVSFQTKNIDQIFHQLSLVCVSGNRDFKTLDIIKVYGTVAEICPQIICNLRWRRLVLKKLTLDCGYLTNREDILRILETQARTLQELHLSRAPFSEAYASFPCDAEMPNLTQLRLWGNVSSNLNFLKLMPKLKLLAWNASCYDQANHGLNILKKKKSGMLKRKFNKNIVENTNRLGADFKLDGMKTLEMELGPVSLECYKMLGAWMPYLKSLRGTVVDDEQFALIGEQWPEIENLELLHGSLVTANGIVDVLVTKGLYKNLKSFVWKYCPCLRKYAELDSEEVVAENLFKGRAGRNIVIPWKCFRMMEREATDESVCMQNVYEMLMTNGNALLKFLNAL